MNGKLHLLSIISTKMRSPRRRQRLSRLLPLAFLSLFALLVLAGRSDVPAVIAQQQKLAPVLNQNLPNVIPDQYMVIFERGTTRSDVRTAQETVKNLGGKVEFTYTSALIGFSARLPANALQALRAIPRVAYIEADQMGTLDTIQNSPPTGLDRTSERPLPLDNRYTYSETGSGVHVYVIDSGIRITHTDFGGRASGGVDEVMDGNGTDDCFHHGTHVAGIIGGTTHGIAKQVNLHPVRVATCTGGLMASRTIAGVDWVTANAVHPAVANMSLHTAMSPSLDTAVTNSINSGITYVAATGNATLDACTISPAHLPAVIAVGSVDPTNDTRALSSGIGTCVDLFAPGVGILSTWNTSDTATHLDSGTSMATPHVAGVATLYLQNHPAATPADVWAAIHNADNIATTPGWAGVVDPGAGSPNELLHWGSLNDGFNDGDPHITTVEGVHYDFQAAGEFVSLRDDNNRTEIQTRQAAIPTTFFPGPNAYTGLATCVSLNTAVAARVGKRRVTYEPNLRGVPDPSGLQLRVDGVLTTLGASELDLGNGGHINKTSVQGGIKVDFPDGTAMFVTPGWWSGQSKWYLNVDVSKTPAKMGIMGVIAPGSWLPALPDGSSLGPRPSALHDRYADLYQKFGDAWRVTDGTSLFDYAPGTTTDTFTLRSWPSENPPCMLAGAPPAQPVELAVAERACRRVTGKNRHADCVFDVMVTGEPGFANTYLASQQVFENGANGGNKTSTNPPLKGKLAIFLDLGAGIPHGTFSNAFNTGFSFNAGLEYLVNPYFSVEGIFGYHRFPGIQGDINLYQFSANAKTYFTPPPNQVRPFVNGGIGAYKFGSGATNFGGNLGAGVLYELTPRFGLQGSYNFHMVNTPGATTRFSTLQGGVRFVF